MLAHLHQPDIDRLASDRFNAADWPHAYRHWNECELCLRRLIDAGLRAAAVQSGAIGVLAEAEMPDYTFR